MLVGFLSIFSLNLFFFPVSSISYGSPAIPGEYPFAVSIQLFRGGRPELICGGSIISNYQIISAAHCLEHDTNLQNYAILVGGLLPNEGIDYYIESVEIHKKYDKDTYEFDVVIISLKENIDTSNLLYPPEQVLLPVVAMPPVTLFTVIGWGFTEELIYPESLQQIKLPMVNIDTCRIHFEQEISDIHICAGFNGLIRGAICNYDSGNPLLHKASENGKYTIYGVAAFQSGHLECNDFGVFNVFTSLINREINSWLWKNTHWRL